MPRTILSVLLLAAVLGAPALTACSAQKSEESRLEEQAPPPAASNAAQQEVPAPPPSLQETRSTQWRPEESTIPEEQPRVTVPKPKPQPKPPATVTLTIPAGTSMTLVFSEPLTSETAAVGDTVTVQLKTPIIVGDRVAFPAGSRVEGKVSDVKSASKGFKETGGALALTFDRIVGTDGRKASILAGFTKVAEGSGKKKAAIIGGSAVGGALLGKVLGKDEKGAALVGGAIGTAVAGSTRGLEAKIAADEEVPVSLESAATVTVKR
jgi:hypothetical protein